MRTSSSMKWSLFILLLITVILIFSFMAPALLTNAKQGSNGKSPLEVSVLTPHEIASEPVKSTVYSINPYYYIASEPAPMGITDFGYSTSTGPYSYNSTSFMGTASINSFYAYNQSFSTGLQNSSAFQLNLNLQFTDGSSTYTYWVQDVAVLYSSASGTSQHVLFIDNVWNFSSPNAQLYSNSLSGNGTVSSVTTSQGIISYYYYEADTQKGNNITMHTPATLSLKAVSSLSGGVPQVKMMYNDGYGWISYDSLHFTFAQNIKKDSGFVVDGYNYNPQGLYYDSEFIIGGPGGGSSTIFQSGSLNLSLQYWNGHNYQAVPSAYNFGSDTGESISNVGSSYAPSVMNATLFSHTYAFSGSLKQLYSLPSLGLVTVILPFNSGTATVNGRAVNFTNYGLNLTLYPGVYNISINSPSIVTPLNGSFDIVAGQNLALDTSSFGPRYTLHVHEHGLKPGTAWTLQFANGLSLVSNTSEINATLGNGQYTFTYNSTTNYSPDNSPMTVVVDGANITTEVNFSTLYSLNFLENGIRGIMWSVQLNGNISYNTGSNITFREVNGTYNYTVMHLKGYSISPGHGAITVNGSEVNISVTFTPIKYSITVHEIGLPAGLTWYVILSGNRYYSNSTALTLQLANGTYAYTASSQDGSYVASSGNHSIFVDGSSVNLSINFSSVYNKGGYLFTKIAFVGLMIAIVITAAIVARKH